MLDFEMAYFGIVAEVGTNVATNTSGPKEDRMLCRLSGNLLLLCHRWPMVETL